MYNLLVNVPRIGIDLGGGRDMTAKNNIIINSNDRSISYDSRARDGITSNYWFIKDGGMWKLLYDSPWKTELWQNAFPQMTRFSDNFDDPDDPDFVLNPAFSDVSGNIIVNITGKIGEISDGAKTYSKIDDNFIYRMGRGKKLFNDFGNGDYTLKNAPDGFEQIPLEEIGRY